MMFSGGKNLSSQCSTNFFYSTHKDISNGARIASIRVHMKKLCH